MEIKRCMNCMEELSENNGICPACGTDNRKIEQLAYALRCRSILHERYLIGRVLGQGGFGITYIGMDMLLNIKVAIKEYFPMGMVARDPGDTSKLLWNPSQASQTQHQSGYDSFLKEARKMARIDEIPSIVRVRDLFLENETAYIVMDFVEGTTLKQKLSQEGPMAFSECLALLRPMMEDLAKVHKQGMIHRDISPDNIMIRKDGKVRLLDLGAAKDMTTAHGVSSQVVAKNGFSPIEQYMNNGKVGPWTDVYAVCATIYYCITGKLLPGALERLENSEVDFPNGMKEPLKAEAAATLQAGLGVRAENRIPSMEELLGHFTSGGSLPNPVNESVQKKDITSFTTGNSTPVQQPKQQSPYVRVYKQSPYVRVYKDDGYASLKNKVLPLMRSDVLPEESGDDNSVVFENSSVKRSEVHKITFLNKLENVGRNAWDVSAGWDRTVIAWTEPVQGGGYHLYIGGEGGVRAPQICKELFSSYYQVTEINFNGCFDTSQATDMSYMFDSCFALEKIEGGYLDTGHVKDMRYMFKYCKSLKQLDVSRFDTGWVENMRGMFCGCEELLQLDVSGFDTSLVTDMGYMFSKCKSLLQLDVSSFTTFRVTDMYFMFNECRSLGRLDLSRFDMSNVQQGKNYMFRNNGMLEVIGLN